MTCARKSIVWWRFLHRRMPFTDNECTVANEKQGTQQNLNKMLMTTKSLRKRAQTEWLMCNGIFKKQALLHLQSDRITTNKQCNNIKTKQKLKTHTATAQSGLSVQTIFPSCSLIIFDGSFSQQININTAKPKQLNLTWLPVKISR